MVTVTMVKRIFFPLEKCTVLYVLIFIIGAFNRWMRGENRQQKNVRVCVRAMWLREPILENSIWWPALIFTTSASVFRFICFFSLLSVCVCVVSLVFLLISRLLYPKSLNGIAKNSHGCKAHMHNERNAPFVLAFFFCFSICSYCMGLKLMPAAARGSVNPQEHIIVSLSKKKIFLRIPLDFEVCLCV